VGEPGGCNPIPLPATVTGTDVRIRTRDLADAWERIGGTEPAEVP
jgi:uncharacterized membrane protein